MGLGSELVLMGMGTVFTFLILLIFFTTLMSKLVGYYEDKTIQPVQLNEHQAKQPNDKIPEEILTQVITAALQQHRSGQISH